MPAKPPAPKFVPVDVVRRPATDIEARAHFEAFVQSFILPERRHRWLGVFDDKRKFEKCFQQVHTALIPERCIEITSAGQFPSKLQEVFGHQLGVFMGPGNRLKLTAAEAATVLTMDFADGIWSFAPGKLALVGTHDGVMWRCERRIEHE
jgi:hypothetical protein